MSLNDIDSGSVVAFERSADAGIPEAQYSLGLIYATGQGVVRDYVPSRTASFPPPWRCWFASPGATHRDAAGVEDLAT